ncbi:ATPase AAA [Bacteroidia bacterium]|nr:ATPase AAA [Bacteroidia bacterium]
MLVSTIEAIFKGQKELFKDLYIYNKWDWTQQNPVIRLDFAQLSYQTTEALINSLADFLKATASIYGLVLSSTELPDRFAELIRKVSESTGKQVVVLIDEYDKPITDHLTNLEIADANREIMRGFYGILKPADQYLRFFLLTGVSKFAKVSIFSELNNLNDITMDARYASICGYTQTELETSFDEYTGQLADLNGMDKPALLLHIRKWYNGYSWDGATLVYNPFSTLLLFDKKEFSNYWFESGTPTFLINLIKERNDLLPILKPVHVDSTSFSGFDIQQIGIVALLFQTGYLTVKNKTFIPLKPSEYTLDFPNEEVKDSFFTFLLSTYANYPLMQTPAIRNQMQKQIQTGDAAGLAQNLQLLLANIPNQLHIPKEAYYHSLFLTWMKMLGFDIQGEVMTNIGRIDAVWHQPDVTVVAELKYDAERKIELLLDDALTQIHEKKYYEKYLDRKVILLGLAFSGKEVSCRIEPLN